MSVTFLLGFVIVANTRVYAMLNSTKNTMSIDNNTHNINIGNDTLSCSKLKSCGGNPSYNNPPSDNCTVLDIPL